MSDPEPLISDPDRLDVVGARINGGLDLFITVIGPLDESKETHGLLTAKVRRYLEGIASNRLIAHFGAEPGPCRIVIACPHPIADATIELIERLRNEARSQGVDLSIETSIA